MSSRSRRSRPRGPPAGRGSGRATAARPGGRRGLGDAQHIGIGGHDEDLRHAAGGERRGDGAAEQQLDELVALLRVEDGAQPRLRALERADGDRDGGRAGTGVGAGSGSCTGTMLANVELATAASTSAARRARDASSRMIVSVTTGRRPERLDGRRRVRILRVEHEDVDEVRVQAGDAEGATTRGRARRASGPPGPLSALPPMIGETARDRDAAAARRGDGVAHARHVEDRRDRDERVGRRDDDRLGRLRRPSSTSGVGVAVVDARRTAARARPAPGAGGRSTPGTRASRRRCGPRSRPARRLIGRIRAAIPSDRCAPRHASVSRAPARSRAVRTMWSARSRSPSANHVSSP